MSNNSPNDAQVVVLKPQKRTICLDYTQIPKILGVKDAAKGTEVSDAGEVRFFEQIFGDLHKQLSALPPIDTESQVWALKTHAQSAIRILRPSIQRLYSEHGHRLNRMLFHLSEEMVSREENFFPFLALQIYLLSEDIKRNKTVSDHILGASDFTDIDIKWVQENLRQDTGLLAFPHSHIDLSVKRLKPTKPWEPSSVKTVGRTFTFHMADLLQQFLPEYTEYQVRFREVESHSQGLLPEKELSRAVLLKYIDYMRKNDKPEAVLMLGDHGEYDDPKGRGILTAYLDRSEGHETAMNAFRTLLASNTLVSYSGILTVLFSPPYHHLWCDLILDTPRLRKQILFPQSPEARFFETAFPDLYSDGKPLPASFIAFALGIIQSEGEGQKKSSGRSRLHQLQKYTTPDFSGTIEEQRDQINRHIQDLLLGRIPEVDVASRKTLADKYSLMVARKEAEMREKISGIFYRDADVLTVEEAHQQKRIELDLKLIGLEIRGNLQPTYIDCSLLREDGYHEDIRISVSRRLPGEKTPVDIYTNIPLPADGYIPLPEVTLLHNGKILYAVTFTTPEAKEFEINTSTKTTTLTSQHLSKPEEIVQIEKPEPLSPEIVEEESLKTAFLVLQTYETDYERTGTYSDDIVTIVLDEKHIRDKRKILPIHRKWTITDAGEISPTFEGEERSMIVSLADKIRVRVKRENEEKEERNKEAQSLSAALIILSEYGDIYEQEGSCESGLVTIQLQDEHIQSVLSAIGEEGSEVREHHRVWTITDAGDITPIFEGEERSMILSLAEKIRARVEQEKIEEEERKKLEFIAAIDAEFQALGFALSDALDTADLRRELERKIVAFKTKNQDAVGTWDQEIARLKTACTEKGYLFYRANCENGFPKSITLGKKSGWMAILELQPVLKFILKTPPQEHAQMFGQRMENALMTFAYDTMKNGSHSVEALAEETRAREDLNKLKKHYKKELKNKKAKIIAQDKNGHFQIIRNISRANLETELVSAQAQYGQGNVALLLREATYRFQGEQGCIRFDVGKILATYRDFEDADICHERRTILRERIVRTLCKKHVKGAVKRGEFIPGSGVDQVLTEVGNLFEGKKGSKLGESDIDDAFLSAFIDKLKSGDSPVPVSYVNHRVAYCRPDDVASLIAD